MSQPCSNCGTLNLDSYRFCSNCGAPLHKEVQAAQATQPISAVPPVSAVPPISSAPPAAPPNPAQASSPPMSYNPPPGAFDAPPSQPAYVVKTSPDAASTANQDPTLPMGAFTPPAPSLGGGSSQQAPPTGYQQYGPGASARKDGAVYAPYPTAPITALEKPKDTRSWLVPIVVVAALLLVGIIGAGVLIAQNKGTSTNAPVAGTAQATQVPGGSNNQGSTGSNGGGVGTAQSTSTPLPASASDEDKIREVIRRSNEQQIKAWQQLNVDLLKEHYTGQALTDNMDMVNRLKQSNMSAEPVNQKLDILDVKVEGDKATAHTIEVWTVTFTNKLTKKKEVSGPDTLNETYNFVKQNGKWLINNLVIPTPVPPTATPAGT